MKKPKIKIVVFGALNSGKTTFIEKLVKGKLALKGEFGEITTSLDLAVIEESKNKTFIFGTPGHTRFKFMWRVLAKGLKGAILLIDSTVGVTETDREIYELIRSLNVPLVVAVNKCDLNKLPASHVRKKLDLNSEIKIFEMSALKGYNVKKVFESLLAEIRNE